MGTLNAKQLRDVDIANAQVELQKVERNPMYLLLENVYDTYNTGGLFRLSDALAVSRLYLCGEMEIPPNGRIQKASIGTYKIVPWAYRKTAVEAIVELRKEVPGIQIVAVEQDENSKPYTQIEYTKPVCLIVGNETFGVSEETKQACDHIAEIPMWGVNKSLNVIVSAGIVSYHVVEKLKLE